MALNEASLRDRLEKLNSSKESIENTSSWLGYFRKEAGRVVAIWEEAYAAAPQEKRLAMLYLANDVIQNTRKKGAEYVTAFFGVLPRALRHTLQRADERTRAAINKLVHVWEERRVFGSAGSKTLHQLIEEAPAAAPSLAAASPPVQPPKASPSRLHDVLRGAAAAQAAAASAAARWEASQTGPSAAALAELLQYQAALGAEVAALQASAAALRATLASQEAAAARAAAALARCAHDVQRLAAAAARPAGAQSAAAPAAAPPAGGTAAELAARIAGDARSKQLLLAAFAGQTAVPAAATPAAAVAEAAGEEEYDPEMGPA